VADYTNTKSGPGAAYPDNAVETQWQRLEPLVTPEQVRSRHLFGIPLVSQMVDPITKQAQVYTDDLIADTIDRSVAQAEQDTGLDIFPMQVKEKAPFDRAEYMSFGYMRTERRPVASVEALTITPANNVDIFSVPLDWIETAYLPKGQLNIVPLVAATGSSVAQATGTAGAIFLAVMSQFYWVPAFWQIKYTTGFPDGLLPKIVNEYIGVIAAMEILSSLASTYGGSQSYSLGIGGASQSQSTPGPDIFTKRFGDLEKKRDKLKKQLKTQYGLNIFSGNV
jgi:hypothetical protein